MSYASVIVFLDNSVASQRRLEFALQFAAKHQAHLTGIHLSYGSLMAYDPMGDVSGALIEWERENKEKQLEAKEYFAKCAKNYDVNVDWDCYRDSEMNGVLARARVADICIVGQPASDNYDIEVNRNFFTRFAISSGKPALFIPNKKEFAPVFEKIVVAWNGGRESARAVTDAMPLLKAARIVSVISVVSKNANNEDLPDVNIAEFLARHKVNVEIERDERKPAEAAEFILSRADLKSADLLVMGAFGHTRFSEFILGGMTRAVLQKMALPVFMSH